MVHDLANVQTTMKPTSVTVLATIENIRQVLDVYINNRKNRPIGEKLTLESEWNAEVLFTNLNTKLVDSTELTFTVKEFVAMLELMIAIFTKAKAEVMALLANDNFHRWKDSKDYKDSMINFKLYSKVDP